MLTKMSRYPAFSKASEMKNFIIMVIKWSGFQLGVKSLCDYKNVRPLGGSEICAASLVSDQNFTIRSSLTT